MSRRRSLRALFPVLAVWLVACGSGARPEGQPPTPTHAPTPTPAPGPQLSACADCCTTADDCRWGEIRIEITQPSDCMCLFGCPSIAMDEATFQRRRRQYEAHCTPHQDGDGQRCPVDDCAAPPPIACVASHCRAAPASPPGVSAPDTDVES